MAYYYKINDPEEAPPLYKGFHLQKVKKFEETGPRINYDFTKHVLIELLDDTTPEADLWHELSLTNNNNIIHKRMMIDSHRMKCRKAVVICINSYEAKQLAQRISQTKVMGRCICAVVVEDLLSDLCLFEKQIIQFGDSRRQQQLLYVSDLSRCRGPSGLVKFLKEKFSPFGTILSVLVCSDDDGYAFPEGVIKFAYLSEAFAAELAYDQYIVGKERLSVTTHHNILLSQCDLRVRLRDAHLCNNMEYNTSADSFFQSHNQTSEQNVSHACSENPVVNDMNNLQISHINANQLTTENNLTDDRSEVSLPAFSQYNYKMNIPNEKQDKNSDYIKKKNNDRRIKNAAFHTSVPNTNIRSDLNIDRGKNIINSCKPDILVHSNHRISMCSAETMPIVITTKYINQLHDVSLSNNKKPSKNISDSGSFVTCTNFLDTNLDSLCSPSKETLYDSFHSDEITSTSEFQTVSSDCKQISSPHTESINGFQCQKQSLEKFPKKRKKKFTPSQKLCLKSQRSDLSQSFQNTSARTEISVPNSSQPEKSSCRNKSVYKKGLNLAYVSHDSSGSAKVVDWLSNIPVPPDIALCSEMEESMDIEPANEKCVSLNKHNRISIKAPSIKSSLMMSVGNKSSCSDDSYQENEDPNKNGPSLFSKRQPIPLINNSKSPLQAWLKQELMSSINNRVVRSQETLKSSIVCATKTKDVIITVGCSHMTCDSCYPESTDLLLGYN